MKDIWVVEVGRCLVRLISDRDAARRVGRVMQMAGEKVVLTT